MYSIEAKIKNKERSIQKAMGKIKSIEQQLIGLEEIRLFCSINKKEVLKNEYRTIKCDSNIYKNWRFWPSSVGGENANGGITYITLFSKMNYYSDRGEIEVSLSRDNLLFFEECYQQMRENLNRELVEMKRKLNLMFEEYGKLTYDFRCKVNTQ